MHTIRYYFSLASPFAYLAGARLEKIAEAHSCEVDYRPIDFPAVGAETGWTPLPKRHPSRLAYREQDLRRIAAREGMKFNLRPAYWPVDTLPASRALIAAEIAEFRIASVVRAFMRALWAEERDISDPETVDAILRDNGIAPNLTASHLDVAEQRYRSNSANAPGEGVFGVPFYVVGEHRFWGQDRLADLDRTLADTDRGANAPQ